MSLSMCGNCGGVLVAHRCTDCDATHNGLEQMSKGDRAMTSREDYPLLAWMEGSAPWPEGPHGTLAESVTGALDHIEALRSVVHAAIVWRRCESAMHGNTADAARRHYEAVWGAKQRLHERLDELLVEGAAGRGAP